MFRFSSLLICLFLAALDPSAVFADRSRAIIILDASGSMWGQVQGKVKIEAARETIADVLAHLPFGLDLGLMAYGHRRDADCEDIEVLLNPDRVNRESFMSLVNGIKPRGKTPLTAAVKRAADSLSKDDAPGSVILVSDGLETCNGDPCELADALARKGIELKVHVVAFDLLQKDAETFRCLADKTGGKFLLAQDAASLRSALKEVVVEAAKPVPAAVPPTATPEPSITATPAFTPSPVPTLGQATLQAPDEVIKGRKFEVSFEAPSEKGDWISIAAAKSKDRTYDNYSYVRNGNTVENTVELRAPVEPGDYEIRYLVRHRDVVIGRRSIKVIDADFGLKHAGEAGAGSSYEVAWSGPNGPGDFISFALPGDPDPKYLAYAYTNSNPVKVRAPGDAGDYELRYVSGHGGNKVFFRSPVKVVAVQATLIAADTGTAGSPLEVSWTGPGNGGDFVTITNPKDAVGAYKSYEYAKAQAGTARLTLPLEPGDYELRYVAAAVDKVLARRPITVTEASATISAPSEVVSGSQFEVKFTGPGGDRDLITFSPANHTGRNYQFYKRLNKAKSPIEFEIPELEGAMELRYVAGDGEKVLARWPVKVVAPKVTFKAIPELHAAMKVAIDWDGPNNRGDKVCLVTKSTPDRQTRNCVFAQNGTPQKIEAPSAGEAELRYISREGSVVARQQVQVLE